MPQSPGGNPAGTHPLRASKAHFHRVRQGLNYVKVTEVRQRVENAASQLQKRVCRPIVPQQHFDRDRRDGKVVHLMSAEFHGLNAERALQTTENYRGLHLNDLQSATLGDDVIGVRFEIVRKPAQLRLQRRGHRVFLRLDNPKAEPGQNPSAYELKPQTVPSPFFRRVHAKKYTPAGHRPRPTWPRLLAYALAGRPGRASRVSLALASARPTKRPVGFQKTSRHWRLQVIDSTWRLAAGSGRQQTQQS